MTLKKLQKDCAQKRAEYQIARQVYSEATRLAVADTSALERELQQAMLGYYAAHGALHESLRLRAGTKARLH